MVWTLLTSWPKTGARQALLPLLTSRLPHRTREPDPFVVEIDRLLDVRLKEKEPDGTREHPPTTAPHRPRFPGLGCLFEMRVELREPPGRLPRISGQPAPGARKEHRGSDREVISKQPPQSHPNDVYQGAVRLNVVAYENGRGVLQFVNGLRETQGMLLTNLEGSYNEATICLRLLIPVRLKDVLRRIDGVSKVDALPRVGGEREDPVLNVQLAGA